MAFFYGRNIFIISGIGTAYLDAQSGRDLLSRRGYFFYVPDYLPGYGINIVGGGQQDLELAGYGECLGSGDVHSVARDIDRNSQPLRTILAEIDQQAFVYSLVFSFFHKFSLKRSANCHNQKMKSKSHANQRQCKLPAKLFGQQAQVLSPPASSRISFFRQA
jgi:hypothetical protein